MIKVVILYAEVMGYTMSCLVELVKKYPVELYVVHWDKKKKTPIKINSVDNIHLIERSRFDELDELIAFVETHDPAALFVSGWMDKLYLSCARYFKKRGVKTISFIDNQWNGTIRQRVGQLMSTFYLKSAFDKVWVSGLRQYEFAKKMGYLNEDIEWGVYAADVKKFSNVFNDRNKLYSKKPFPKSLLFVGRYNEVKNLKFLLDCFINSKLIASGWSLTLIGNGPQKSSLLDQVSAVKSSIFIKDFVQPDELSKEISKYGFFCLASTHEPWGVVIHEFAIAGFPLIISEKCGAADHFVKHGYNGYKFNPLKKDELISIFNELEGFEQDRFQSMMVASHKLGVHINPEIWASTFMSLIRKRN